MQDGDKLVGGIDSDPFAAACIPAWHRNRSAVADLNDFRVRQRYPRKFGHGCECWLQVLHEVVRGKFVRVEPTRNSKWTDGRSLQRRHHGGRAKTGPDISTERADISS